MSRFNLKKQREKYPIYHYYNCGACGKKKADLNTTFCRTCEQDICNNCWIIGNPDPNAAKLAELVELPKGITGKIFDPKCKEILWCCPKCNTVILTEPVDYLDEEELEAAK